MKPKTFFKITDEEQIKKAHKEFGNRMYRTLDEDIRQFKKGWRKMACCHLGNIFTFIGKGCPYEEVPNPFLEEFPKKMLVWDDYEENAIEETVIAYVEDLKFPYLVESDEDETTFFGYKNAKDIEQPTPIEKIEEDIILFYLNEISNKLSVISKKILE